MWKIAWGVVLGLLLWHTLPLILSLIAALTFALLKPHAKHDTPASAPYGNGAKPGDAARKGQAG